MPETGLASDGLPVGKVVLVVGDTDKIMMVGDVYVATSLTGNAHDPRRHGAHRLLVVAVGLPALAAVSSHVA
jgi:hypothetical protein